jgi:hypothetical protein
MIYALGRGFEYYDAPAVRKIVRESAPDGYKFQPLILGIVKSTPFEMRKTRPAVEPKPAGATVASGR